MSEKIEPVESNNKPPAHGKMGGGRKDVESSRTSESGSGMLQPTTVLIEKSPEIIKIINKNYYGLLYVLDLLFLIALITVLVLMLTKKLDPANLGLITTWGRWFFALIAFTHIIAFADRIFNLLFPKPISDVRSGKNNISEMKQGDLWQSPLSTDQVEFVEFYKKFKNLDRLIPVEKITIQMLKERKINGAKKNNISLYSYRTSGVYQEGSNSDYIEPIPPLTTSRIYAMQLVYKRENRNKGNKGSLNLNIADTPVPGSNEEMWWSYPWSDVLENIALIASPKSNGRIIAQLLAAYDRNKGENLDALQLACKIAASGAKVENYALTELLKVLSEEKIV